MSKKVKSKPVRRPKPAKADPPKPKTPKTNGQVSEAELNELLHQQYLARLYSING